MTTTVQNYDVQWFVFFNPESSADLRYSNDSPASGIEFTSPARANVPVGGHSCGTYAAYLSPFFMPLHSNEYAVEI